MKHPYSVVKVTHANGCATKFKPGRYISASPAGAAKKAASQLCSHKRISGQCSVERTDVPQEKRKTMTYKVRRIKLPKPQIRMIGDRQIVNKYKTEAKAFKKSHPKCRATKANRNPYLKSSGPMSRKRITRGS
jgi:formamidopyrimidine-DNA glycosylase